MNLRNPPDAAALRGRAEERLARQKSALIEPKPDVESARLLHELQVHQIELQMQNVELQATQASLEATAARYTDLYDFAPMGYFALERNSAITRTNLAGARLLGVERAHCCRANASVLSSPRPIGTRSTRSCSRSLTPSPAQVAKSRWSGETNRRRSCTSRPRLRPTARNVAR